jgi:hypothetical protein
VHHGDRYKGGRQRARRWRPDAHLARGGALLAAVLPGWELTTRLWRDSDLDASSRFGFATVNSGSKTVIRDGWVDIASA